MADDPEASASKGKEGVPVPPVGALPSPPPPLPPPPPAPPAVAYVFVPTPAAPPASSNHDHLIVWVIVLVVVVPLILSIVFAAVLFGLVGGLLGSAPPGPTELVFGTPLTAASPDGKVFYGNVTIVTVTGTSITVDALTFALSGSSGGISPTPAPSFGACTAGSRWTCPAPTVGWYLALQSPGGNLQALFPSSGGGGWNVGPAGPVGITSGDQLTILSSVPLAGDTLSVQGSGGHVVAGGVGF